MKLRLEPMVETSLSPYGRMLSAMPASPEDSGAWPRRLASFPLPMRGAPVITILESRMASRQIVQLERHTAACRVFIPLHDHELGLVLITDINDPATAKAFHLECGTACYLHPRVWHAVWPMVMGTGGAYLVMDDGGALPGDTEVRTVPAMTVESMEV